MKLSNKNLSAVYLPLLLNVLFLMNVRMLDKKVALKEEELNFYLFSIIDSYFPYRHLCFATSLSEKLLITSADCVINRNIHLIAVKINLNSKIKSQRFKIRSIHVHGNYNCTLSKANDNLALIKIENTNRRYVNKFL